MPKLLIAFASATLLLAKQQRLESQRGDNN